MKKLIIQSLIIIGSFAHVNASQEENRCVRTRSGEVCTQSLSAENIIKDDMLEVVKLNNYICCFMDAMADRFPDKEQVNPWAKMRENSAIDEAHSRSEDITRIALEYLIRYYPELYLNIQLIAIGHIHSETGNIGCAEGLKDGKSAELTDFQPYLMAYHRMVGIKNKHPEIFTH